MSVNNNVFYPVAEEIMGEPSLKVDETKLHDIERAAEIISTFSNISKEKLIFFIKNFGIVNIFKNPTLLGVTDDQKKALNNIEYLILGAGENI